jgi:hypothetical protein
MKQATQREIATLDKLFEEQDRLLLFAELLEFAINEFRWIEDHSDIVTSDRARGAIKRIQDTAGLDT